MSREGLSLKQAEGVLDRIDQRPLQVEEVETGSAREDESRQAQSDVGRAAANS